MSSPPFRPITWTYLIRPLSSRVSEKSTKINHGEKKSALTCKCLRTVEKIGGLLRPNAGHEKSGGTNL